MCQSLADKVAQSRQLSAITDPDSVILFEDWFDELEAETRLIMQQMTIKNENVLAARVGVSARGVKFLITKLSRDTR